MSTEQVQRLFKRARKVLLPNRIYWPKYGKYGMGKQIRVDYYWFAGYLFTVDSKDNVLITIHKQPASTVKFC